ncbi:MAG: Uma2 family endonuclease [Prochlorothrix sp.]
MIALPDRPFMTPSHYLTWEPQQPQKYEYLNRQAYAKTSGSIPHNDIAINLIALLKPHLRGSPCKINASDAKVCIDRQSAYFYPDLVVTCDPRDRTALDALRYPCLIIEVLSPGTDSYDRGQKFRHYRRLASLQEYVLISSDRIAIDRFCLNDRQKWELTPYEAGDLVELSSIALSLKIEQIYENVILPDGTDYNPGIPSIITPKSPPK